MFYPCANCPTGSIPPAKVQHLYIPGQTQGIQRREGAKVRGSTAVDATVYAWCDVQDGLQPADFVPLSLDRDVLPEASAVPKELQLARCREESLLPDVGTLHARMLLGAWEVGLEDVSEDAARLLCVAVQVRAGATADTRLSRAVGW